MTTYRCLVCGKSARRLPAREADLLTSSWLNACGLCAARQLAETVDGVLHDIRDLCRDADEYADAGLLPDDLEAQINALAAVAKDLAQEGDDEPTVQLAFDGLLGGALDNLDDLIAKVTS